jgi:hypothetical protein
VIARHPHRLARSAPAAGLATRPTAIGAACACLVLAALLAAPGAAHGKGRQERDTATLVPDAVFTNDETTRHATFSGVVTDAGGAPLAEVAVAMCGSACWPTTTDESGRFSYPSLPVERYVLDVRGESVQGRTLTSVVLPVELPDGGRELPPLQLHDAMSLTWGGTAPVALAGLRLLPAGPLDLGALQRATGTDDDAAHATIGGTQVPPAAWPHYELAAADTRYRPLAMWALYPFGARVGGMLTLQAARPPEPGVSDDDLAFFTVDVVTGTAEWLGPALVEDDYVHTGPDSGISTLTWVILASRSR